MSLTNTTLQLIQQAYRDAFIASSRNCSEITERFLENLNKIRVPEDDMSSFNNFLTGIERCLLERKSTFKATNLFIDIADMLVYITAWLNQTKHLSSDIAITLRRKALESEFAKLLRLASNDKLSIIKDRFGLRLIILNESSLHLVYLLANYSVGILCNLDRTSRSEFINWIKTNNQIDSFSKEKVLNTLNLPLELYPIQGNSSYTFFKYPSGYKDYIQTPKENGYKSLHVIIQMGAASTVMPGITLEFQFRDFAQHILAERHKDISHTVYKKCDALYRSIFQLKAEDLKAAHMRGYLDSTLDLDGVSIAKIIHNRRMNNSSF